MVMISAEDIFYFFATEITEFSEINKNIFSVLSVCPVADS
jgi:hypothetical protein